MIQDLLYVPVDYAAYEHCYKYCPDCDTEFPLADIDYDAEETNSSYAAAYDEEGMEIGLVDKKVGGVVYGGKVEGETTVFVSMRIRPF